MTKIFSILLVLLAFMFSSNATFASKISYSCRGDYVGRVGVNVNGNEWFLVRIKMTSENSKFSKGIIFVQRYEGNRKRIRGQAKFVLEKKIGLSEGKSPYDLHIIRKGASEPFRNIKNHDKSFTYFVWNGIAGLKIDGGTISKRYIILSISSGNFSYDRNTVYLKRKCKKIRWK